MNYEKTLTDYQAVMKYGEADISEYIMMGFFNQLLEQTSKFKSAEIMTLILRNWFTAGIKADNPQEAAAALAEAKMDSKVIAVAKRYGQAGW